MIDAQASKPFDAALEGADTGLVGTIGVRVVDGPAGATLLARRTAGITEYPAGSGVYNVTLTAPPTPGGYLVLWDTGEPLTPAGTFTEELNVYAGPPPSAPAAGTLASLDDLKRYLRTTGTVSAGASLDEELLKSLLSAAASRVRGELRDRTLDVLPASESDPPVEIRVPLTGYPQRIVQVPDLRELVSLTIVGSAGGGGSEVIDLPGAWATPSIMRVGRERAGLWLRFPAAVWGTELAIVGRWGPAGVTLEEPLAPLEAIREAVLVWAARAYHNRTARYADTVQDPAGGVSSYFRNLPPDVATTIDGLRVPGI